MSEFFLRILSTTVHSLTKPVKTPMLSREMTFSPPIEFLDSRKILPNNVTGLSNKFPFSEAVRVGQLLMLSGQVGVDPKTYKLRSGGIKAETTQALDNIKAVLESYGLGMENIVSATIMLSDINEWEVFNKIYRGYFSPPYPTRSAFGVNGLAVGASVEIACTVAIPSSENIL